jgi:hypothetical protein
VVAGSTCDMGTESSACAWDARAGDGADKRGPPCRERVSRARGHMKVG